MADLTQIQLVAALSEQVYNRNASDDPITLRDLGVTPLALPNLSSFGTFQSNGSAGSTLYYTSHGFVGEVVQTDSTVYVVFRGTDISGSFPSGFNAALSAGLNQTASDPSGMNDLGDLSNDILLGQGTGQQTQLDDALALTQAAKANAGGKQVVVVGQSLGGGLAGLVSAIADVPAIAIDPAPFQNQLSVAADEAAFSQMGFNQPALFPDGVSSDFFSNSDDNQRRILEANGYSDVDIDQYFTLAQAKFGELFANLQSNLTAYSVTGEILSSGIGLLGSFLGGATPFSVSSTAIDVGVSPSIGEDLTTAVSLHSPTLFNLLIRTEGSGEQFEDLLKSDEELRYSLLENQNISGPIEGNRADPDGSGFGQSGVVSSGASTGELYRALWETVGATDSFYDHFYARFGAWLSNGAVAEGLSATATQDDPSVHSGVVKLGLQVVRDGLGQDGLISDAGLNVFGAGDANGPSAGYIRIDLNDITPSDPSQQEMLSSSGVIQDFGVRDINLFVEQQAENAFGTSITQGDLAYLSQLLGATRTQIATGKEALSPWQLLIVQAGAGSDGSVSALTFDPTQTDDSGTSTVVIGGNGVNTITGSSAADFLVGGDGKSTFKSGGGKDTIIGGNSDDTYMATSGPTEADSVSFLGGGGANKADYSQSNGSLDLTLSVNTSDNHVVQLTDASSGASDSFVNVQKIVLSNQADDLKITAADAAALKATFLSIDAGGQGAGQSDVLDLSAAGNSLQVNDGHIVGDGVNIEISNFETIIGGGNGGNTFIGDDEKTAFVGGEGDDQLTAGSAGDILDGGVSDLDGNQYVGGAGADYFVIGNGSDVKNAADAEFYIDNAGDDDRLVLRLSDTLGVSDPSNLTAGIVLTGGVQATTGNENPDFVNALFSPTIVNPTITAGGDGAAVTGLTLENTRADLGDFFVYYFWDKPDDYLDITINTAYGDFEVQVANFENGQLGLTFTDAVKPTKNLLQGNASDLVLESTWATYNAAERSIADALETVDLPSPGNLASGSASPWTTTAETDNGSGYDSNLYLPVTQDDLGFVNFNPTGGGGDAAMARQVEALQSQQKSSAGENIYQVSSVSGSSAINLSTDLASTNEVEFGAGVTSQNLWFQQVGQYLDVKVLGTASDTLLKGWFGAPAPSSQISADGLKLDGQAALLVQAMATYSANNSGFDPTASGVHTIPNDTNLQSSLASAWHA